MPYHLIVGIIGLVLILVAFLLNEFSKTVNSNTLMYNLLNLFGAGFLTYYGYILVAWPFVILNIVWFLGAIFKLGRIFTKK